MKSMPSENLSPACLREELGWETNPGHASASRLMPTNAGPKRHRIHHAAAMVGISRSRAQASRDITVPIGHLRHLGDLAVCEALEVAQHQRLAERRRQRRDPRLE
jgi:hypothetical protein